MAKGFILGTSAALAAQFGGTRGEERLRDVLQAGDDLARMLNGMSVKSGIRCAPDTESFHIVAPAQRMDGINFMGVYKVDAATRDSMVQRGLLPPDHEIYELFGDARAVAAAHNSGPARTALKGWLQNTDEAPHLTAVDITAPATPLRAARALQS